MNEDNVKAWVENLRSTTAAQGRAFLCEVDTHGVRHFCCLGLGSKQAGIPHHVNEFTHHLEFGENSDDTLAPYEFLQWLDLVPTSVRSEMDEYGETLDDHEGFDVYLDMPHEFRILLQQGNEWQLEEDKVHPARLGAFVTATALNDSGFTFPQIADMLDYFGVKQAE